MPSKSATIPTQHAVQFGGERIDFTLSFANRKHLRISVHPDLRIAVDAPAGRTVEDILDRVRRRAPWIIKQKDYFGQFQPLSTERRYVSGETHCYLGRQYRLKVAERRRPTVKLIGGFIHVGVPDRADVKSIGILLRGWYREHGRAVFDRRLDACYETARRWGIPRPQLRLRHMNKRWGSCSKLGEILLNTDLVKAPRYCVDYVIMHELCHLKYPNHSKGFYRLLGRCMPDWERRKKRLEQVGL